MSMSFETFLTAVFETPWAGEGAGGAAPSGRQGLDPEADPAAALDLLAQLMANPEALTPRFTPEQIGRGLWFLADPSCSSWFFPLVNASIPWPRRETAIRSIGNLYARLFPRICQPRMTSLARADDPAGAANLICYMLWDLSPLGPRGGPARDEDLVCLEVMRGSLEVPHLACQEGALHGLADWGVTYPAEVRAAIGAFLQAPAGLSPALRTYAEAARPPA